MQVHLEKSRREKYNGISDDGCHESVCCVFAHDAIMFPRGKSCGTRNAFFATLNRSSSQSVSHVRSLHLPFHLNDPSELRRLRPRPSVDSFLRQVNFKPPPPRPLTAAERLRHLGVEEGSEQLDFASLLKSRPVRCCRGGIKQQLE